MSRKLSMKNFLLVKNFGLGLLVKNFGLGGSENASQETM